MAIRLREIEGRLIALCAVESDPKDGDVYLDDRMHQALAEKFWRDYKGQTIDIIDHESDRLAETQKVRDAKEELCCWLQSK